MIQFFRLSLLDFWKNKTVVIRAKERVKNSTCFKYMKYMNFFELQRLDVLNQLNDL